MIIIDAGHGGSDYGGGSNSLFSEKDLALKISLYQYEEFKKLGIPVILTRTDDETLSPSDRINRIKSFGDADILISNHINSSSSNFSGSEVIYSIHDDSNLANLIAKNLREAGRKINRVYTRRNSRGNDYYYIIRNTRPTESVIVEYGFGDNPDDRDDIYYNYKTYALSVVNAVLEYLGYNNYYNYTVKKNDSLYKIANKTGVTVDEIKSLNNIGNLIKPNQVLKIPYRIVDEITYFPSTSETITSIANKYDTSINSIKKRNNILSDTIDVEKIYVPLKTTYVPYIVKKGDTLYKIAQNYQLSLYQLASINNTNQIHYGDVILVPMKNSQ